MEFDFRAIPKRLFGPDFTLPGYLAARWLFLRALGLIFFSAFYSLAFQIRGLIGPNGILPARDYLVQVTRVVGSARFWYAPTVFWWSSSDRFLLGVVAQGVAICATTTLQQEVDDDFRGRVFAVNDMVYNTAFALGAAISVPFMPISGHSVTMLLVVAVGYVIGAGCYRLLTGPMGATGQPAPDGGSVTTPDSPAQRSSS